jgi:hypothetical protein
MVFRASKEGDFTAKPLSFPGTSFDPSLLCNKTQWFLEFRKRFFIAKPLSFLGIIFDPSLCMEKRNVS